MKCNKYFLIGLLIISSCISSILHTQDLPETPNDQNWTKSYTDPIELAKKSIDELNLYWSPVTYYSAIGVYRIGSFITIYGGAYILLESPNIVVSMVKGGFYEVGTTVGKDFILDVIETAVKTPKKSCINITNQLMSDGLKDYKAAYDIVKKYRKTKQLSTDEALKYLSRRWGILKLPIARILYDDVQNEGYSIDEQLAKRTTEELLEHFEDNYQKGIGVQRTIGIVDAAFFIKDVRNILKAKKFGLPNYTPYQRFEKKIELLNKAMMEEKERLNQPEDFEEFVKRFFEDEQFQKSRIIFPLEASSYDWETGLLQPETLVESNWSFYRLQLNFKSDLSDEQIIQYLLKETGGAYEKEIHKIKVEADLIKLVSFNEEAHTICTAEFHFRKTNGLWNLVFYIILKKCDTY